VPPSPPTTPRSLSAGGAVPSSLLSFVSYEAALLSFVSGKAAPLFFVSYEATLLSFVSGTAAPLFFVSYEAAPLFFVSGKAAPLFFVSYDTAPLAFDPYDTAFLSFALPIDYGRLSTSSTPSLSCLGSDICVIIGLFSSPHSAGGVESGLPPPLSVCKFTGDMFGNGRLLTNPPSFDCYADPRLRRAGLDSGEFACLDCLPVCVGGEYWI
jgi:hypothetical protein